MATETITLREIDTQCTASLDQRPYVENLYVPGLTILAHPDSRRVGQQVALPELSSGRGVPLSRLEPRFKAPGELCSWPLEDAHLSRRPIMLTPGDETGAVRLDCRATHTTVEVEGRVVNDVLVFTRSNLERGVVLTLSHRLVLLLHLLPVPPPEKTPHFGLVGDSDSMVRVRQQILKGADLGVPVLLRGDTGTGKELVARAVHQTGPRRHQPFVAVNMGAIPPALAAAELFGVERGAYTGAERKKAGFFQRARFGTLFLDEIAETPTEVQGLLLRALDSGEIQPVGSVENQKVDVRVIAATDIEILAALADGRFREPLYHRLAGYEIQLPPLRERREDIGRLLVHFLGGSPPAEVVARLARYDWPGNVRELRNVARRLATEGGSKQALAELTDELLRKPGPAAKLVAKSAVALLSKQTAAEDPSPSPSPSPSLAISTYSRRRFRKLSEVGEAELLAALETHRWHLKLTAEELEISRATLYRLIERYPRIRKAVELESEEIEQAMRSCGGDPAAVAARLKVSPRGLKRRMKALGLLP